MGFNALVTYREPIHLSQCVNLVILDKIGESIIILDHIFHRSHQYHKILPEDLITETYVKNERDYMRFEFKPSFGLKSNIAQPTGCYLIGWWRSQSEAKLGNTCWLTWNITWTLHGNPGPTRLKLMFDFDNYIVVLQNQSN